MIENTIFYLVFLVEKIGYLGVGLSMFIESFFVPIPSEVIMPFAGFLASQGKMNLFGLIIVGGISSYLGSLPFYFLGYLGNELVVNRFLKRYGKYLFISEQDVDRAFEIFKKYGNVIVLLGRIIPLIRSVISFPAGVAKMNFYQFTLYTLVGSIAWSAILGTLGYLLGSNWNIIGQYINQYENITFIVLGISVVSFVLYRLYIRKKRFSGHF